MVGEWSLFRRTETNSNDAYGSSLQKSVVLEIYGSIFFFFGGGSVFTLEVASFNLG